jgi:hypothetical protein
MPSHSDTFFNALVAYMSSFIVVFFTLGLRFTLLLDHVKSLDDTIILISSTFDTCHSHPPFIHRIATAQDSYSLDLFVGKSDLGRTIRDPVMEDSFKG